MVLAPTPELLARVQASRIRFREAAGVAVINAFFRGAAAAGRAMPHARPERHGLELLPDIPYQDTGLEEHLLDVYRPIDRSAPLRTVLYVHGGGFRLLSKESHWLMGLIFARRGSVVFNVNYRLAPKFRFPAGIEDVCKAYLWVLDHAAEYGGDPNRIVLAGESAGANLISALTIAATYRRPEKFAREVYDRGIVPKAVIPACGIFQVTDPERFERRRKINRFVNDRLHELQKIYLTTEQDRSLTSLALADPLPWLEQGITPDRPLPPFFMPVGTRDPLVDDTRRMTTALRNLGGIARSSYYEGGLHAFHAFIFLEIARACWRDSIAFVDEHCAAC